MVLKRLLRAGYGTEKAAKGTKNADGTENAAKGTGRSCAVSVPKCFFMSATQRERSGHLARQAAQPVRAGRRGRLESDLHRVQIYLLLVLVASAAALVVSATMRSLRLYIARYRLYIAQPAACGQSISRRALAHHRLDRWTDGGLNINRQINR